MNADAIQRVARALRERLKQAVVDSGDPTGTVFVGPLDDPDAASAALILFLYRVVPSAALRNREHRVLTGVPPALAAFQNALPLDLYFLVTVGTRPGTASEEPLLRVLGFAMQALQMDPELRGPEVSYETVHLSLETLTTEESARIWTLFPTANFRTSVAYLATPVWIDPPQPLAGAPRVTEDRLDAGTVREEAA